MSKPKELKIKNRLFAVLKEIFFPTNTLSGLLISSALTSLISLIIYPAIAIEIEDKVSKEKCKRSSETLKFNF